MKKNIALSEGLLNWSDLKDIKGKIAYSIMFIFLLTLSLVCLVPVLWMMLSAYRKEHRNELQS